MLIPRRYARWPINKEAQLRFAGVETVFDCYIKDISFMGLRISLAFKLPKDKFLRLIIVLSDKFILEIEAWVVWHKNVGGQNVHGIYFSKIPDSSKEDIFKFARYQCPDHINLRWWQGLDVSEGGENMQQTESTDKRIFARFPVRFSVRFLDRYSNREIQAQAKDICAKGVCMVTKEELKPGTPLEMWLEIPDRGEPLYARGEVAWSRSTGLEKCCAGVNLDKADLIGLSRVLRVL